jgi:hypothetical protein
MPVMHNLLIGVHALCAIAACVFGVLVIWRIPEQVSGNVRAYLSALSLMALFLLIVVLFDWANIDTARRVVYSALLVLVAYTSWRGWHAARVLAHRNGVWRDAYVEDVGFTLISLFDGFVVVSAIDLGAPMWLVVVIGVIGIVVGRVGVVRVKIRATAVDPNKTVPVVQTSAVGHP